MEKNMCAKISELLKMVKTNKPLVHHITNYVTANDCANTVLAIGASPIIADDEDEVADIVSLSAALVLNIGTLNSRTIASMLKAGVKANDLGIPVVLDPVGAGATALRSTTAGRILREIQLAVIRGNMSEIKAVSGLGATTKGVDVSTQDMVEAENPDYGKRIAENLASRLNCAVAITGAVDIVAGAGKTYLIANGHSMLSGITGTGCMCSSLIGAYCAVTGDYLSAATAGILTMALAGELAYERLPAEDRGAGSYRVKLFDALFDLSGNDILKRGKVREG
jgi:hydroxyethylthiazole kinase